LIRLETILSCDGQTDRRKDGRTDTTLARELHSISCSALKSGSSYYEVRTRNKTIRRPYGTKTLNGKLNKNRKVNYFRELKRQWCRQ